jgi:hypothetical protein
MSTIKELRGIAKRHGLKGYSKMNRAELEALLKKKRISRSSSTKTKVSTKRGGSTKKSKATKRGVANIKKSYLKSRINQTKNDQLYKNQHNAVWKEMEVVM